MPKLEELVRHSIGSGLRMDRHSKQRSWSLRLRTQQIMQASLAWRAPLELAPLASSSSNGRHALRLGPDEWLLLADASSAVDDLHTLAASTALSLVDISDRELAWTISGANADRVLATSCPLDLSEAAFPPGRATRTVYGHAEIVLWRPTSERSWQIRALRSFANYLTRQLAHAGKQCTNT